MTIEKAMREYRLPETTTPEDLEMRWRKPITFGDKILLGVHYYNGKGKPSYFGAVYTFTTTDHSCEGQIRLTAASGVDFEDEGHAILWAMRQ